MFATALMKDIFVARKEFEACFIISGAFDVSEQDCGFQRGIKLLHYFFCLLAFAADNNPVWVHEIIHSTSFPQEFGVAYHVKFNFGAYCKPLLSFNFFTGLYRNCALIDYDFVGIHHFRDCPCSPFNIA